MDIYTVSLLSLSLSLSLQYWGLNLETHDCQTGALPFEPFCQPPQPPYTEEEKY
jgi:hypothetical protein